MSTVTEIVKPSLMDLEEIRLADAKLDPSWARALPAAGARRFRVIAICEVDGQIIVATSNARVDAVSRFVSKNIRRPFRLVRTGDASIRRLLAQVHSVPIHVSESGGDAESNRVVSICDELFQAARLRGASDIHLVPNANSLQCSFRVDGLLEHYRQLESEILAGLTSRIKVLAGLNIAEKREPQDGRFTLDATPKWPRMDVRVATIPTRMGERLTLRLLAPMSKAPSLCDLGMSDRDMDHFDRAIQCTNGLILLTGPTGCGKSTTLYTAIIQLMKARGGNVITIEDPVEYEIPGTTQVEVDSASKLTFPRVLRSILRHDPDIIMLGEIRDAETAELAIKASLTGHLVFSTLHTNTAAGVVTRLIDMGVEPFLVAATLRMAIAQRLVRRLCEHCQQPAEMTTMEAAAFGDPSLTNCQTFNAKGCVYCSGKGFSGRTALFEMLRGDAQVAELITRKASEAELLDHMRATNSPMMIDDGIAKVLSGTTTAEQVIRAVQAW